MSGSSVIENVVCRGPEGEVLADLRTADELLAFATLWNRKKVIKRVRTGSSEEHFTHKLHVSGKERSTLWLLNAQGLAAVLSKGPVPLYRLDDAAAFNTLVRIGSTAGRDEPIVTRSAAEPVLNKANLDRVKRHILRTGGRCTYSNMYNHNPCLITERYRVFLDPDPGPGPDGHPQWNLNCDAAKGDFHTLVVLDEALGGGYSRVRFLRDDHIVIEGPAYVSPARPQEVKAALEAAVQGVLADAD